MKNDGLGNVGKREGIEKLLDWIMDDVFDQFVSIGRDINDYGGGEDEDDCFNEDVFYLWFRRRMMMI